MKTKTLKPLGISGFGVAALVAVAAFASLTMLARADVAPTVTTTIYNPSNTAVTSANIGTSVFATAVIASSSTTTLPTGTVIFNRYANTSCTGTPTSESGVALVNGIATSSSFAIPASGLSYQASYSGDANNSSVVGTCKVINASASNTSITTTLSTTSVLAGSTVNESATLSGVTANAGGSVAYAVYTNNSCTTALQGAGVKTVTNAIVPNSDSLLFNNAGTYYWQGVYSGDASNVAATSSCLTLTVGATSTAAAAMVSGTVYNDTNTNLTKDGSEVGLSGFTVNLREGTGFGGAIFKTTTTDSNGYYSFGALANGTYSVELVNMSPWQQDIADYNSVAITNQTSVSNIHFAVHNPATSTPTTTGMISGKVFNDSNKDGSLTSGEAGVAGVTVKLYQNKLWWNTAVKTAVTDANGNYSFSGLANGTYAIELIKQDGWKQTSDDYKSVVISNNSVTDRNFGVWNKNGTTTPPVATTTSSVIGGRVYNDANKNDTLDNNEAGVAGFTIKLFSKANWNGQAYQTVVTDANGNYSFSNLPNGTYSVELIAKDGWKQTSDDFKSLKVQNGNSFLSSNFSVVAKNNNGNNGNNDNGNNGWHWGWFKNIQNNGWHWGWEK